MLLHVVVCPNILARDLLRTKTGHSANTQEVNIFLCDHHLDLESKIIKILEYVVVRKFN